MNERETHASRWIAALKFLPLLVFGILVILCKLDLLIAAPIATMTAIFLYMLLKRCRFEKAFDEGKEAAGKITLVFFILMFAYGVAECFMATGVGAALIRIALALGVTARTIALVALMVTCVLSVATGTSWGTFAACAPIFLWMNRLIGGNAVLTLCCIAGGSCFGDNIGMISDTTVLSCGLQDVKIIDRVKHQGLWSVGCLVITAVIVFLCSLSLPNVQGDVSAAIREIPQSSLDALAVERPSALALLQQVEAGVPYYMVIPLIVVVGMSFFGLHTLACLGAGMLSSLLLGMLAGTTDLSQWLNHMVYSGFSGAGSWVIVMMLWVAAFGGIMNAMNAFDPLARLVAKCSANVHHLLGWCGVLCIVGNMALSDETAQIATMSGIMRDIVDKNVECADEEANYRLRLRLATYADVMGIYSSQFIPWHCYPVFFCGIANTVCPGANGGINFTVFDIVSRNYLSFIVVGSFLLLSFTGWDRFIPGFSIPGKERAWLRRKAVYTAPSLTAERSAESV